LHFAAWRFVFLFPVQNGATLPMGNVAAGQAYDRRAFGCTAIICQHMQLHGHRPSSGNSPDPVEHARAPGASAADLLQLPDRISGLAELK
jgi:hypothetical protein